MRYPAYLLIAGLVLALGCAAGDHTDRTEPAAPPVVTLTATEYAFEAPDTIVAGFTTFLVRNRGEELHYAHIVRLETGRAVQEFIDAYAEAIRTSGPRPTWMTRFGGPGGAAPGDSSSATQYLEPGDYVWICPIEDSDGTPHFAKGEVQPFVVRAAGPNAADQAAPEASMVIRLLDYTFALETPLRAGRHVIRVENAGTEPHDVALLKLAPGKTLEDVRIWLDPERERRTGQRGDQGPPLASLVSGSAGGIAVIAPGMEAFFEAELTPGEYLLVCFTTAPDGRSHIEHGMIQQIRVG